MSNLEEIEEENVFIRRGALIVKMGSAVKSCQLQMKSMKRLVGQLDRLAMAQGLHIDWETGEVKDGIKPIKG